MVALVHSIIFAFVGGIGGVKFSLVILGGREGILSTGAAV